VKFEGIGSITVSGIPVKTFGEIDNIEGFEGALLYTDGTTNTKFFRDLGKTSLLFASTINDDFNTELTGSIDRTTALTLLITLLRLTLIRIDNSNTGKTLLLL
jgi:hypothetical protein